MSKIFDAFKKAESGRQRVERRDPASEPIDHYPPSFENRVIESVPFPDASPLHTEPFQPQARLALSPSGLELPLEFVRELGTLRGTVDQLLPGKGQKTLLLAGSIIGEGASTVSTAFARLLAEDASTCVALIDGDLRSVEARRLPTVGPESGFAGVLAGHVTIDQALVGTSLPNLAVLPGGVTSESPLRLCTPENLRAMFDYLKRHFHYVIVDGAPLLDAPEAIPLAAQTDGIILVVRAARTKREVVQRAIETTEKFQARVLGAILNRQQYVIPEFIYRRI